MRTPDLGPSWDENRVDAPSRPSFISNLALEPNAPRPRRVAIALILVIVAALSFAIVTALAALHLQEVREALADALPKSVVDDYSEADIRRAVQVLIGVVSGLGLVLTLVGLLSVRSLLRRRSSAARIVFVLVVALHLPTSVVTAAVRHGGRIDEVLSVIAAVSLLTAAVLICTRPVSAWLQQTERHDPIPLVAAEESDMTDALTQPPPKSPDS